MGNELRILFLDDDLFNHRNVDYVLGMQSYPFRFEKKICPLEAVESVKCNDYDCIITDFNMPKLNGRDFIEKICQVRKEIPPVIGFSSEPNAVKKFGNIKGLLKVFNKSQIIECFDFIKDCLFEDRI